MGFVSVEVVLVEGVSVGGASVFRSVSGWAVDVESRAERFSLEQQGVGQAARHFTVTVHLCLRLRREW